MYVRATVKSGSLLLYITGLSEQTAPYDSLELRAVGVTPEIIHQLVQNNLLIPRENIHLAAAVGQGSYLMTPLNN